MTFRSTAMGAENVLLFILVWTVCQADDNVCSVNCEDVTGTVGKEVTLTCNVSQKRSECCFIMYKFPYPEKYHSTICRDDLPEGSCEQRNIFTCRYTPTTAMTEQFSFLLQTKFAVIRTEFIVDIIESIKPETGIEAPGFCSVTCADMTVTVGKEVTLTCSVPQQCIECCITLYKFYYTKTYTYSICRQVLSRDSCEQRNRFTCRYTPTTAVSEKFGFFVQTMCGWKKTEFTVDVREPSKPLMDTEDPGKKYIAPDIHVNTGYGSTAPIRPTGAVVGCFIIIIIIIIIGISVFCVQRFKRSNPSGLQIEYVRGASEDPTMTTVNNQNETK